MRNLTRSWRAEPLFLVSGPAAGGCADLRRPADTARQAPRHFPSRHRPARLPAIPCWRAATSAGFRSKLGITVSDDFATLDRDGVAPQDLFAMGPMLRGRYGEINAIPEIAVPAETLAKRLGSSPKPPVTPWPPWTSLRYVAGTFRTLRIGAQASSPTGSGMIETITVPAGGSDAAVFVKPVRPI
jgi:hypothetical protein